jgi:chemotaxis protein MotB
MSAKRHPHHGGAWKVAYADFVTAMMALFMVLWLTAQDQRIKEAVERAFRNPFSAVTKESVGIIPNKETQAVKSDKGNFDSASAVELAILRRLNDDLNKLLQSNPEDAQDDPVKMEMMPEGLRISVFDRARKAVFEPNSEKLTEYGRWIFSTLAWEVSRFEGFTIELEGHTERGHPAVREDYGNWELSADRANTSRRVLMDNGVHPAQIKKVAGFADTMPMADVAPEDEANRRVAVLLKVRADDEVAKLRTNNK